MRTAEELTREEMLARWRSFFDAHAELLEGVLTWYPAQQSVEVDCALLVEGDEVLLESLLSRPQTTLYAGETALKERIAADHRRPKGEYHVNLRPRNLPARRDVLVPISQLRQEHAGRLVAIQCIVRKRAKPRLQIEEAMYECQRCHGCLLEPQDPDVQALTEPVECYKDQGGCGRTASSTRFKLLKDRSELIDEQRVEVQELPEESSGMAQPEVLGAVMLSDLVGAVEVGDRLLLNGTLSARTDGEGLRRRKFLLPHLSTVSIEHGPREANLELTPEDVDEIQRLAAAPRLFERLVAAMAPTIYGLEREKLALVLQQFGGTTVTLPDGTRRRGDIHILLMGDPSTGKSKLLSAVRELSPRAVMAAGGGASAVGLTGSVRKERDGDGSSYVLEAGALVLADRGLAIVDEFDKMGEDDRGKMHEAMEDQRVQIHKAGINAELRCACGVLAALNPKGGRVRDDKAIHDQTDLPLPLLHRFDAIFLLRDRPGDRDQDAKVARHMLAMHAAAVAGEVGSESKEAAGEASPEDLNPLSPGLLRKYIHYARTRLRPPLLTSEVMVRAEQYFLDLRKESAGLEDGGTLISRRHLDGIIRFSEASARARLSSTVDEEDVGRAIHVFEAWARSTAPEGQKWNLDVIYGGLPSSVKDDMNKLKDIIRSEDHGAGAPKAVIVERAHRDLGMREDRVLYLIEKLYQEGGIYEREDDRYRVA